MLLGLIFIDFEKFIYKMDTMIYKLKSMNKDM